MISLETLPPGSELILLLMSVSGVGTWWSKNILKSKPYTMFFAFLGVYFTAFVPDKRDLGTQQRGKHSKSGLPENFFVGLRPLATDV